MRQLIDELLRSVCASTENSQAKAINRKVKYSALKMFLKTEANYYLLPILPLYYRAVAVLVAWVARHSPPRHTTTIIPQQ